MKAALGQAFALLAIAAALSGASYALWPEALPWGASEHEVELATAREWEDALWIDARTEEEYERGHYDGALLLNEDGWEAGFLPVLEAWAPGAPIVVYCSSQSCLRSHQVAERLREELGAERVYALRDGWEALQAAGLVEGGER